MNTHLSIIVAGGLARTSTVACYLAVLMLCVFGNASLLVAQDPPSRERGFSADTAYSFVGDLDQVNLFNGNLTITLPIGQQYPVTPGFGHGLTAVYNSNVWQIEKYDCWDATLPPGEPPVKLGRYVVPEPDPTWNAGLGWSLHMGRLFPPAVAPFERSNEWIYMSPDGGQHSFYDELHPGMGRAGEQYTADGTYLRMRVATPICNTPSGIDQSTLTGTCRVIEEPGGTAREFRDFGTGGTEDWRLTRIFDSHSGPHWVEVRYGSNTWTIHDSEDRQQVITFNAEGDVASVAQTAFGGNHGHLHVHLRDTEHRASELQRSRRDLRVRERRCISRGSGPGAGSRADQADDARGHGLRDGLLRDRPAAE